MQKHYWPTTSALGSGQFWPRFGPALLVLGITIGFVFFALSIRQWDPMVFVRLGTRYGQGDPNGTIGYDGQFAYQMALQPLNAAPYMDIPPYRYQRILYPLVARILTAGQPTLIPWMLIGLNVVALVGGSYIMSLILIQKRLSPWYALPVGLFAGQLVSLRLDVNEPFALAFVLLGIHAFESKKQRLGAVYFALSLLSKETAIAFVGAYLLYFLLKRRWRTLIETGLISLTPFALLQLAIWWHFGEVGLRSGGHGATTFSLIPFGGLLAFGLDNFETFLAVLLILGPLVLLPCLALTVRLVKFFWRGHLSPQAFALTLHIVMMATLPFSTYVDLPGVLRLTSGLVVATLIFGASVQSGKILNYAMLWLASVPLLIFLG